MAKENETVTLTFDAKDEQTKTINKINGSLKTYDNQTEKASKSSKKLTSSLKGVAVGFAGVASVGAAISFAKKTIDLAKIQIEAETKLAATIKATGSAAGLTAKQLGEMASSLQGVTTVGDEAILGAQSLLLTFKNIGGNIFPRVTEAVLDMSEAMGQDLKSSSIQLGKALNDPIKGVAALNRIGIQFTETQKDQIKFMQESNNLLGAQDIILKEVESQFGGVARAMAETDVGKIIQMNNELGDMKEELGTAIIPFWLKLNRTILEVVRGARELTKESKIQANFARTAEIEEAGAQLKLLNAQVKLYADAMNGDIIKGEVAWGRANIDGTRNMRNAIEVQREYEENLRLIIEMKKLAGIDTGAGKPVTTPLPIQQAIEQTVSTKSSGPALSPTSFGNANLPAAPDYSLLLDSARTFQDDLRAIEEDAEAQRKERSILLTEEFIQDQSDRQESIKEGVRVAADSTMQILSIVDSAISNKYARERNEIDNVSAKRKEDVKSSKMSSKQQAKEIAKIEKEAAKQRHELAMKEWKLNLVMAIANTALGVTKALASSSPPLNIVMAALTGIAGAASIATIASNKPKFAHGGYVPGNSFAGDKVEALVNSDELILNKPQQDNLFDIATGKTSAGGNSIGQLNIEAPQININGNVTDENIQQIQSINDEFRLSVIESIYEANERNEIDSSRFALA